MVVTQNLPVEKTLKPTEFKSNHVISSSKSQATLQDVSQVQSDMTHLFHQLQKAWSQGGRVDSRYEVLLDKIIPYILNGSYAMPTGWYEKYSSPFGVNGKVLGSGSNGRILSCTSLETGLQVAVKVTLAMYGATHEVKMLHHCKQFGIGVVEILDQYSDKTISVTVLKMGGTPWTLENLKIQHYFQGLQHEPLPDKNRRTNVRDLYACVKLHACFGGMPMDRIKRVFGQLASLISLLHRQAQITHGDLKLQNVLIDENLNCMVVDLSAAKFIKDGFPKRFAGAPMYGSPEALRGFAFDGEKNDIWSLGVMLYMMRFGADQEPNFTGISVPLERRTLTVDMDMVKWSRDQAKKHRLILPGNVGDDSLKSLLRGMLDYDLTSRFTMDQILSHPFVTGAMKVERVDSGVADVESGRMLGRRSFWQTLNPFG